MRISSRGWPPVIDLWLRIDLLKDAGNAHMRLPAEGAFMAGSGVYADEIRTGSWEYSYSSLGPVSWKKMSPGTKTKDTTAVFRIKGGGWKEGDVNIRVIDKRGNSYWPDVPHFLDFRSSPAYSVTFPAARDEIRELQFDRVENGRDFRKTICFDGVALPAVEMEADAPAPVFQMRWAAGDGEESDALPWAEGVRHPEGENSLRVEREIVFSDGDVRRAGIVEKPSGQMAIQIRFNDDAAKKFAEITRDNIGRRLAMVVNGEVVSASAIQTSIIDGAAQISGSFTREEAEKLVKTMGCEIDSDEDGTDMDA